MAGNNLSPRQKMINLMYLVFIAMLALNMSKEVLQAFGLIQENYRDSNANLTAVNEASLANLKSKAAEQAEQYGEAAKTAEQVSQYSQSYYNYLGGLIKELDGTLEAESLTDYQVQDKSDYLDEKFFVSDRLTPEGQEFIKRMDDYRKTMVGLLGKDYAPLADDIKKKFDTSQETNRDGIKVDYLNYHYQGFPMIASKTKLTLLQNEIKSVENDVLSQLLQGKLVQIASMNNYKAIVSMEKSAYFTGETVKGTVVLGRYDDTTVPNKVVINGQTIASSSIQNGQVPLNFSANQVGEKTINGTMEFVENGKTISLPIEGTYAVIPRPNSATISADKMNVVYRGVDNPMTISFAGVPDNKVSASAPGLSKAGKGYVMRPGQGTTVTINVTGTLDNGETVRDNKSFRIKNLPAPTGMISGEYRNVQKNRSSLAISTVSAEFIDFDFDLKPTVTSFQFKAPGKPSVNVSGNKMNAAAQGNLRTVRKNDIVTFTNIQASVPGIQLKSVSDVAVEIID